MYICGGFGKNNGPSSHGSGLYSNKQSLRFRFEFSEAGFVDLNDELFVDDLIQYDSRVLVRDAAKQMAGHC
jgi:hypothetical protein